MPRGNAASRLVGRDPGAFQSGGGGRGAPAGPLPIREGLHPRSRPGAPLVTALDPVLEKEA